MGKDEADLEPWRDGNFDKVDMHERCVLDRENGPSPSAELEMYTVVFG